MLTNKWKYYLMYKSLRILKIKKNYGIANVDFTNYMVYLVNMRYYVH